MIKIRIHEIIYYFKTYFLLGIIGLILLGLVGAFGYLYIYKKKLKGKKSFSKKQLVIAGLFIAYIIMVFGVTFLSRGSGFQGSISARFLSSYREAWNSFSSRSWQLIILNIFMFMPFGFLLPLLHKRFYKIYNTLIVALSFTLFIETFQLVTRMGIFDVDDIFNNFLGALLGYGIIMALISALKANKNKGLKIMGYLSPLIITITIFIAIFVYYDNQEFGNIGQDYIYKINLKNTNIEINASLTESRDLVPIYKAPTYTKEESLQWARDFFENMDIDTSDIDENPYNDNNIFTIHGEPGYSIWFYYIGGSYSFTDFSQHDYSGVEPINVEEELVLKTLSEFGIHIPDEASFSNEDNDRYKWEVDKLIDGDILIDGSITCTYFSDNTIKDLDNNLIIYNQIRDVKIKSVGDALEELSDGKFSYYNDSDIDTISIEDISLDYVLDTKGFYQPVYKFNSDIDGNEYPIIIPAINE